MPTEPELTVSRAQVIRRGVLCHCPNCGKRGLLASWFRLNKACAACGMDLAKSHGFYSGTTSIGYVAAILFVLIPDFLLVSAKAIGVTAGILLGMFGSFGFIVLIYPAMLCWMVMAYHVALPGDLPVNGGGGQGDDQAGS